MENIFISFQSESYLQGRLIKSCKQSVIMKALPGDVCRKLEEITKSKARIKWVLLVKHVRPTSTSGSQYF